MYYIGKNNPCSKYVGITVTSISFYRLLLKGAQLIAIHSGRYYKTSDGLSLGPGPFVKGLEYAADCRSEVVGKPSPTFFRTALGDLDPSLAVMIGDVSFITF